MKHTLIAICFFFWYGLHAQSIQSRVDPCSGELYVHSNPSRVDTSHTYKEAVQAYFERQLAQRYERFDITSAVEIPVDVFRIDRHNVSVLVELNSSDPETMYVSIPFAKINRKNWDDPLSRDDLMPDVVPFADFMNVDVRDILGVPSKAGEDYILSQAILQVKCGSLLNRYDTIVGVRNELVLNPVLDCDSKYSPRAYLSLDSSSAAIYLFVPQYKNHIDGNFSLVRILIHTSPGTNISYSSVPAYIFGSYGFDQGDCQELGFY